MKLLSKIKAFFQYRGQQAELDASAAEIKNGRVYLHPKDNPSKVYCIRSNTVDILISPRENICEEDLEILEIKKPESAASSGETQIDPTPAPSTAEAEQSSTQSKASIRPRPLNAFYQPMKRITFTMYPEEYDMFMSSMQKDGFKKKTEFFLACVSSAKKNSMQANYQKYAAEHKARRIADRQAARQAQAEDLQKRQNQADQETDSMIP